MPNLSRRTFINGLVALFQVMSRKSFAIGTLVSDRLCIGDNALQSALSIEQQRQRLLKLQEIGFGCLRTSFGRLGTNPALSQGDHAIRLRYIQIAASLGYRLKISIDSWSGTPDNFERDHPEAKIVNHRGQSPRPGYLSAWYPGLKSMLVAEQNVFFEYLKKSSLSLYVAALIIDLGPAGEPIYPADWIMKQNANDETFWFYDTNAQSAFVSDMKVKYLGSLASANHTWNTQYENWAQVKIPEPKTAPGALWSDVLLWYRDAKRNIIRLQVETCRAMISHYYLPANAPQIVILLPGSHLRPEEMREAIRTGDGDYSVKIMIDTDWLIDLASEQKCALQYTAAQNDAEVSYVEQYISSRGLAVPLWGENAGGKPALTPDHLGDVIEKYRLYGLDYVEAGVVFNADGFSANKMLPTLAKASARLLKIFPTRQIS